MAQQLTQQDIEAIIEKKIAQYNTTQGGTSSSFTVPLHRHNGSDSLRILSGDIQYDNRGYILPLSQGSANIGVGDDNLSIVEQIGGPGVVISRQIVDTTTGIITAIVDSADSTGIVTSSTSWYLRLPDNTVLPASPQVGDICIFGGILQVCETVGVWTPK